MAPCPNCGGDSRVVKEANSRPTSEREKRPLVRCFDCRYQYREGDSLEPARKD